MSRKPIVILKNWTVCGFVLYGEPVGHPRLPDGETIRTSAIQKIYWASGMRVRTRNTIYKLAGRNVRPTLPSFLPDELQDGRRE